MDLADDGMLPNSNMSQTDYLALAAMTRSLSREWMYSYFCPFPFFQTTLQFLWLFYMLNWCGILLLTTGSCWLAAFFAIHSNVTSTHSLTPKWKETERTSFCQYSPASSFVGPCFCFGSLCCTQWCLAHRLERESLNKLTTLAWELSSGIPTMHCFIDTPPLSHDLNKEVGFLVSVAVCERVTRL